MQSPRQRFPCWQSYTTAAGRIQGRATPSIDLKKTEGLATYKLGEELGTETCAKIEIREFGGIGVQNLSFRKSISDDREVRIHIEAP